MGRRGGGGGGGDGLLWHTDLKPHACGDFSIAVVQANHALEDQGQVVASPSATYVGVYDGHGGPDASRFVRSRLFPHLHRNFLIHLFFSLFDRPILLFFVSKDSICIFFLG